ncbi:MAG: Peptidylprolyl isomerase [Mucilaginibacter sp.]|nr:Peptidylprolyl isomerase [Mucilaginibacter sp.]
MKQIIFTLLLITSIGLVSCRKTGNDPNITQFDASQIQSYISANGITGMKTVAGDTSGIYYQILSQGSTAGVTPLDYPDSVAFVYTLKSFDGKYNNVDTLNTTHIDNLLGHLTQTTAPIARGLQLAIHDLIKYKGTRARILIPSRLAFGVNGYGTGSSSNTNTRILGNQCLDYYINLVSSVDAYDDDLIRGYMKSNNLDPLSFIHITDVNARGRGLYYKITTPGTGVGDAIGTGSSYLVNAYSGQYLNGVAFDTGPVAGTPITFVNEQVVPGLQEVLKGQTTGAVISMFIPSRLGYGKGGGTDSNGNVTLGPNVTLHFVGFTVGTVTNP